MTRFWLIRHGAHDWLGQSLVGRAPGVSLNSAGREEAALVADALASVPLTTVYSSPMERTVETAIPIAAVHGLSVDIDLALQELDFGNWTNLTFGELSSDSRWVHWNTARAKAKIPGGESMRGVQKRIVRCVERLALKHASEEIALVSHGDVIKAALCWYLGMSLNLIQMLDIRPGGVAALELAPGSAALRILKHNGQLFENGFCVLDRLPAVGASSIALQSALNPGPLLPLTYS